MDNITAFIIGLWVSVIILNIFNYFENKKKLKNLQNKQNELYQKLIDNFEKQNKRNSVSSLKIN